MKNWTFVAAVVLSWAFVGSSSGAVLPQCSALTLPHVYTLSVMSQCAPTTKRHDEVPSSPIDRGAVKNALRLFLNHILPSSLESVAQGIQAEGAGQYALNATRSYADQEVHGLVSSLVEGLKTSSPFFAHLDVGYTYTFGSSASWEGHVTGVFPIWRAKKNLLFSEVNVLYKEKRPTVNIGIGDRYVTKKVLLGANAFFDDDIKGGNKRYSVGLEAATAHLKGAANYYGRLSGWKDDPFNPGYEERTASGYDVRLQGFLPFYPQVSLTARYFQWRGEHINLFSQNDVKKGTHDPKGYAVGVRYSPNQLFSAGVEYDKGLNTTQHATRVDADVHYRFGVPLRQQLAFSVPTLTLASHLFDPVDRQNTLILEKHKHGALFFNSEYIFKDGSAFAASPVVKVGTHVHAEQTGQIKGVTLVSDTLGGKGFLDLDGDGKAGFIVDAKILTASPGARYSFHEEGTDDVDGKRIRSNEFALLIKHTPFSVELTLPSQVQKGAKKLEGSALCKGGGTSTCAPNDGYNGQGGWIKLTHNGTSVPDYTVQILKQEDHLIKFSVTLKNPGFLQGAYEISAGVKDGDGGQAASKKRTILVDTPLRTPLAHFPHSRYVQPRGITLLQLPVNFFHIPGKGANPAWFLAKYNPQKKVFEKATMWTTETPSQRDATIAHGNTGKTYQFKVPSSSPGDVYRVTVVLTPVGQPPKAKADTFSGQQARNEQTQIVFVTTAGTATHTGTLGASVNLDSVSGKGQVYRGTLTASGGTGAYKSPTWSLSCQGIVVDPKSYTIGLDGGISLVDGKKSPFTLKLSSSAFPSLIGQKCALSAKVVPDLDSDVLQSGDEALSKEVPFMITSAKTFSPRFANPDQLIVTKNQTKKFNVHLSLSGGTGHYKVSGWEAEERSGSSGSWASFTWLNLPESSSMSEGLHLVSPTIPSSVSVGHDYRLRVKVQQLDKDGALVGQSVLVTSRSVSFRVLSVDLALGQGSVTQGETIGFLITPQGGDAAKPYKPQFFLGRVDITQSVDLQGNDPLAPGKTASYTYKVSGTHTPGSAELRVVLKNGASPNVEKKRSFNVLAADDFEASFLNQDPLGITKKHTTTVDFSLDVSQGTGRYKVTSSKVQRKTPTTAWQDDTNQWSGLPATGTHIVAGRLVSFSLSLGDSKGEVGATYRVAITLHQLDGSGALVGQEKTVTSRTVTLDPLSVALSLDPNTIERYKTVLIKVTPRGGDFSKGYRLEFHLNGQDITPDVHDQGTGSLLPGQERTYTYTLPGSASTGQLPLKVTLKNDLTSSEASTLLTVSSLTSVGLSVDFVNHAQRDVLKNGTQSLPLILNVSGGTKKYKFLSWKAQEKVGSGWQDIPSSSPWGLPSDDSQIRTPGDYTVNISPSSTVSLGGEYRVTVQIQQFDDHSNTVGSAEQAISRVFHVLPLSVGLTLHSTSVDQGASIGFEVRPEGGDAHRSYTIDTFTLDGSDIISKVTPQGSAALEPGKAKQYSFVVPQATPPGDHVLELTLANEGLATAQETFGAVSTVQPTIKISTSQGGSPLGGSWNMTARQTRSLWYYVELGSKTKAEFKIKVERGADLTGTITATQSGRWVELPITVPTSGQQTLIVDPVTSGFNVEGEIQADVQPALLWKNPPPTSTPLNIPDQRGSVLVSPLSLEIEGGQAPYTFKVIPQTTNPNCQVPTSSQLGKVFSLDCSYNGDVPDGTHETKSVTVQVTDENGAKTPLLSLNVNVWGLPTVTALDIKAVVGGHEYTPDQVSSLQHPALVIRLHDDLQATATSSGYHESGDPQARWTWRAQNLPSSDLVVRRSMDAGTAPGGNVLSVKALDHWGRESENPSTAYVISPDFAANGTQPFSTDMTLLTTAGSHVCSSHGGTHQTEGSGAISSKYGVASFVKGKMVDVATAQGCLSSLLFVSLHEDEKAVTGSWYALKDNVTMGTQVVVAGERVASTPYPVWNLDTDPEMYQKNQETVYWTYFLVTHYYGGQVVDVFPKSIGSGGKEFFQWCVEVQDEQGQGPSSACGATKKSYSKTDVNHFFARLTTSP